MTEPPLLEIRGVNKRFGAVVVAEDLALVVPRGQALGIIGPNGAGKSTLLALISGDQRLDAGQVIFDGTDVTGLSAPRRAARGIGRTYQIPRPFVGMITFENAVVAATHAGGTSGQGAYDRAATALEVAGLSRAANTVAGSLGLLDRKRLELARALACSPKLLLLDEVAGGLTEPEVELLVEAVRTVHASGVTVLWIEHVVRALTATVDQMICLAGGSIIAAGTPSAVLAHAAVQEVYLGTAALDPSADTAGAAS